MSFPAVRRLLLAGGLILVFASVSLILLQLIPGPRRPMDYLVLGTLATIATLAALFVLLVTTSLKASDVFFRRRRGPTNGD